MTEGLSLSKLFSLPAEFDRGVVDNKVVFRGAVRPIWTQPDAFKCDTTCRYYRLCDVRGTGAYPQIISKRDLECAWPQSD
jgi:hypothetical protein